MKAGLKIEGDSIDAVKKVVVKAENSLDQAKGAFEQTKRDQKVPPGLIQRRHW